MLAWSSPHCAEQSQASLQSCMWDGMWGMSFHSYLAQLSGPFVVTTSIWPPTRCWYYLKGPNLWAS